MLATKAGRPSKTHLPEPERSPFCVGRGQADHAQQAAHALRQAARLVCVGGHDA